jgi:tetratricopeptide (TPR) repeat protein
MNFQPLDDPLMNGKKDPEPVSAVPPVPPGKPAQAELTPQAKVKRLRDQLMFDPNNIDLRLQYIEAYLVEGKQSGLVDDYLDLAHLYRNNGQPELARQYYAKVIALDPSITEAKTRLEDPSLNL